MAEDRKTATENTAEGGSTDPAALGAERRFQLLVSAVSDYAIYMLDLNGNVTNWNLGAERIKGYTADEIVGQHFSRFYTEEDRLENLPNAGLRIAAEEGRYEKEGWRVRKDGTRFYANVVIDPVRDERGKLIGFAKITRDITQRKEAERALEQAREALHQSQKLEMVGRLTGGIAHDFNNLLTVMAGSLEIIARERDPARLPRVRRLADNALRAAERAAQLTQQLLAFSRRQALNPRPVDCNALIADFRPMLRHACGESSRIEVKPAPDLWPAHIDPAHFDAALLNLAVNSRDAMPGGGTLTIETGNVELSAKEASRIADLEAGQYVRVSVHDTGEGMPEDVRARAVEPFFTTKEVGRGTGLGLSQVYGFARQSGGDIVIESKPGQGTSVHLYLPRSHEMPHARAESRPGAASPASREIVLVVEDNEPVLEIAIENLEELGYEVISARDGPRALAILESRQRVDILFSDIVMPGNVSGIELAYRARRLRPGLRIVLTSGYAETLLNERGLVSDIPILVKPYRISDLAEKIRRSG